MWETLAEEDNIERASDEVDGIEVIDTNRGPRRARHLLGTDDQLTAGFQHNDIPSTILETVPMQKDTYADGPYSTMLRAGVVGFYHTGRTFFVLRDVEFTIQGFEEEQLQLHNREGPALKFAETPEGVPDQFYFWEGVSLPERWIEEPETLDKQDFLETRNAERLRAFTNLLDDEELAETLDAEIVDEDEDQHGNIRQLLATEPHEQLAQPGRSGWNDQPERDGRLKMVKVICPSTDRTFYLMVPPEMEKVDEAVAWTFGKDPEEYRPEVEA